MTAKSNTRPPVRRKKSTAKTKRKVAANSASAPAVRGADDPRYEALLATLAKDPAFAPVLVAYRTDQKPGRAHKFGAGGLKVNGKLFAMVTKSRLVVKLPKTRVDDLVAAGKGERFDPGHGRVMKQWLSVAGAELSWEEVARDAHAFVKSGKS